MISFPPSHYSHPPPHTHTHTHTHTPPSLLSYPLIYSIPSFCFYLRLVGLLRVESYIDPESHSKKSKIHGSKYGHCNALNGQDPLPQLSKDLLAKINESLSPSALEYLKEQREFFDRVTDISARLKLVKNKLHRKDYIASAIEIIVTPSTFASPRMYLPTDPLRYFSHNSQ